MGYTTIRVITSWRGSASNQELTFTEIPCSRQRKWSWPGDDDLPSSSEEGEKANPAKTGLILRSLGTKNMHFPSNNMRTVCTTHRSEGWWHGHKYHDYHLQYSNDWCSQWDTWKGCRRKRPWVTRDVLELCNDRRDLKKRRYGEKAAKEYREANKMIQRTWRKLWRTE